MICCAIGCSNRSSQKSKPQIELEKTCKITFHRFPRCPKRRAAWGKATGRADWIPKITDMLCSMHFTDSSFNRTRPSYIRLSESAVPSIFASQQSRKNEEKVEKPRLKFYAERKPPPPTPLPKLTIINRGSLVEALPPSISSCLVERSESNKVSRSTSVSPICRRHRPLSPNNRSLRLRLQQSQTFYRYRIKNLVAAQRRHLSRIDTLTKAVHELRNGELLDPQIGRILRKIRRCNERMLKHSGYRVRNGRLTRKSTLARSATSTRLARSAKSATSTRSATTAKSATITRSVIVKPVRLTRSAKSTRSAITKSPRMSTKTGRRSRRKTEDMEVLQTTTRSSFTKDSTNDSMKTKSETDMEELKGFDSESTLSLNVSGEEGITTRSRSATPQNKKSPKKIDVTEETTEKAVELKDDEVSTDKPEVDNVVPDEGPLKLQEEPKVATNGVKNDDLFAPPEVSQEIEMEPLVVDTEEADPELQFDENSDVDSHKSSPVVSRCRTRRSQTRNIPTPKTPRSVAEQNGEDKDSDREITIDTPENSATPDIQTNSEITPIQDDNETPETDNISEVPDNTSETPDYTSEAPDNISEAPDYIETGSEVSHKTEETEPYKLFSVDLNETRESFESAASMKVNVGSDVTREIDVSQLDKDSFLNQAKELSVVETVRLMRCRKSIRQGGDYRKCVLKTNVEKQSQSFQSQASRASIERLSGTKRKRSETPDGVKRFKIEPQQQQQGFFSYLTSPISKIKSRFSSKEMSASTPKLTSFKKQELLDDGEISEIQNDMSPNGEKKWCSIM